jgi:hypothetical protein
VPSAFIGEVNALLRLRDEVNSDETSEARREAAAEALVSRGEKYIKEVQAHTRNAARHGLHHQPKNVQEILLLLLPKMDRLCDGIEAIVDVSRAIVRAIPMRLDCVQGILLTLLTGWARAPGPADRQ